ncbi:MAG: tyrosine-type recombinase/integrase [Cyclobacteriaceae bacterium]|nr:tyrosine-type recombinase/integrase [Cyclobacteriaceae bacterium]
MINSFLKYIEFEKRYSIHTVVSYKNDLDQFNVFLSTFDSKLNLESVTYQHIRSWVISLVEDKISPSSVNRKMASIRSYYKFLLKSSIISKDPSLQLRALRTPKRLPQFAQEAEMQNLFELDNFSDDFEGTRDRLIMELLYATGMRRAELIGLKTASVNIVKRQIKVVGKRNKERVIPLTVEVTNLVQKYLKLREIEHMNEANYFLLLTDKGQPLYETFVYRKVKKYLGATTSLEKNSPHILRHTFATHLLNNGANLNAVKELLGHSSLAATQVYTHNSLDKLKKVFEKAHPKA